MASRSHSRSPGGAYFTEYWADPQEKLVVVFMSQLLPNANLDLVGKLRALVYQSNRGTGEGAHRDEPAEANWRQGPVKLPS